MFGKKAISTVLLALSANMAFAAPAGNAHKPDPKTFSDEEIQAVLSIDLKSDKARHFTVDAELLDVLSNVAVTEQLALMAEKMDSGCLSFRKVEKSKGAAGDWMPGQVALDVIRVQGTRGMDISRLSQVESQKQDSIQVNRPNFPAHEQDCTQDSLSDTDFPPEVSALMGNAKVLRALHQANKKLSGPHKIEFYEVDYLAGSYRIPVIEISSGSNRYRILVGGIDIHPVKTDSAAVSDVFDISTKKTTDE